MEHNQMSVRVHTLGLSANKRRVSLSSRIINLENKIKTA